MQFRWRDNNYHDRIERRKIATTHESRNPNDRARRKRSWLRFCHFSRIQSVSPERCLLVLDVRERQDTAKELATAHDTPEARESEQKRSHTTVNVDPNRIYIYIPIQHRSINRANTDKREIFHWSFADFTFPEENLCRYRKWRQLSRGSPPLFKLFPATVRLEPNFTPLQRYTNNIYISFSPRLFDLDRPIILLTFSRGKLERSIRWDNCIIYKGVWFVLQACDLPLYWKVPLFLAAGGDQTGYVEMNAFLDFWKEE